MGSVHKKGAGEFTLSCLLKIGVQQVPAKKKPFGKDPFTGEEQCFDAKPATVRLKDACVTFQVFKPGPGVHAAPDNRAMLQSSSRG